MPRRVRQILLVALFSIGLPGGLNCLPLPEDIPVRNVSHGLLVAPVYINGQGPFDFVIDTGTNTALIDPALAARLGLSSIGVENLQTLTGPELVQRYLLTSVGVGSQQVSGLFALGQPMTAVQKLDKRINGILGLEFLAHFSFGLDYAHRCLRLYDAAAPLRFQKGKQVAVQFVHDRLLLRVAFADQPPVAPAAFADQPAAAPEGSTAGRGASAPPARVWNLALDSGISQIFIFGEREAVQSTGSTRGQDCFSALDPDLVCREKGSRAAAEPPTMRVTTNQSQTLTRSIVLRSVTIGGLQFRNVPAVLFPLEGSGGDTVVNASSRDSVVNASGRDSAVNASTSDAVLNASSSNAVVDGLLPACLFRSFVFDRATSTIILNPD